MHDDQQKNLKRDLDQILFLSPPNLFESKLMLGATGAQLAPEKLWCGFLGLCVTLVLKRKDARARKSLAS